MRVTGQVVGIANYDPVVTLLVLPRNRRETVAVVVDVRIFRHMGRRRPVIGQVIRHTKLAPREYTVEVLE